MVVAEKLYTVEEYFDFCETHEVPSLQYYLIIDQDNCFVEMFVRDGSRWYVEFYTELSESIPLPFFDAK